jgi:cadmium resistance protein CadD (predicted permease)
MGANGSGMGRWIGALALIAVGVIGLLANFGLVDRDTLRQLWKLWPVIPLLIGLRLLVARDRWRSDR